VQGNNERERERYGRKIEEIRREKERKRERKR